MKTLLLVSSVLNIKLSLLLLLLNVPVNGELKLPNKRLPLLSILIRSIPDVKNFNSSLSVLGESSAVIYVSLSTSLIPPKVFHDVPSCPSYI